MNEFLVCQAVESPQAISIPPEHIGIRRQVGNQEQVRRYSVRYPSVLDRPDKMHDPELPSAHSRLPQISRNSRFALVSVDLHNPTEMDAVEIIPHLHRSPIHQIRDLLRSSLP